MNLLQTCTRKLNPVQESMKNISIIIKKVFLTVLLLCYTDIENDDNIFIKYKYSSDQIICHEQFFKFVNFFGLELRNVEYQTEEICLAAVKNNGNALKYVQYQTEEICRAACLNDKFAIKYVHDQTEELCLDVISRCKLCCGIFRHIRNSSDKVCLEHINDMNLRHKIIETLIDET